MKKILYILLVFCVALSISACGDVLNNQENEVKNEFAMKIDYVDVESIVLQYDNLGQYHLTNEETVRFIELYNQSELLQNSNSGQDAEICSVVINKTIGGYVLLDMYENTDYNFTHYEHADNKFTEKHQIQNASLAGFVKELINANFLMENKS